MGRDILAQVLALCALLVLAGCAAQPCQDADGDGFGDGCGQGSDCDDRDPAVKPGAPEACDTRDNNCDGRVDEGCACRPGQTQTCFAGEARLRGVGPCTEGQQSCGVGAWGPCVGEGMPSPETCNNLDDDCDGPIDEQVTQACYQGQANTRNVGACRDGVQVCRQGSFGACEVQVLPAAERCNGVDDDCDGTADDQLAQSCFTGQPAARNVGVCKEGTQVCSGGGWGACAGEVLPVTETCNNLDDDCDGSTDEALARRCYTVTPARRNVGNCRDGWETCTDGAFGACVGEVTSSAELCNNLDDDCDGAVDQGVTQGCYSGPAATQNVGACKDGTGTCSAGAFGPCVGEVTPAAAEVCGNGSDDDCNGATDEGCTPGDRCANALTLSTATPDVTVTGNTSVGFLADFSGCGSATSPDVVYTFSLSNLERVTLDLTPAATWDGALSLRGGSCPGTAIACANTFGNGVVDTTTAVLAAGAYTVVVKPSTGNGGAYSLRLRRAPVPLGDVCADAITINTATPDVTVTGDTSAGFGADYTSCGGATSPDVVYTFTLASAQNVVLDLVPAATWDSQLSLLGGSCPGTLIGCGNAVGNGFTDSLVRGLAAGTYLVVVKPTVGAGGAFSLRLRQFAAPPGDICAGPAPIDGSSTSPQSFPGDTTTASADLGPLCGPTSRDIIYSFNLTVARSLSATLTPSTPWVSAFSLRGGATCPGTLINCQAPGTTGNRTINAILNPGTYYLLVQGGTSTAAGPYTLGVTFSLVPGYTKTTSPATYIDACTGGTALTFSSLDEGSATTTLPFAFPFYAVARAAGSTIYVFSNGYVTFASGFSVYLNGSIPSTFSPNGAVYVFWDDLVQRFSPDGGCVKTVGVAGSRRFAIEWRNARFYLGSFSTFITFEVVLNEADGSIDFYYPRLDAAVGEESRVTGSSATVGVENDTGQIGTQHSNNTAGALTTSTALRFVPQ